MADLTQQRQRPQRQHPDHLIVEAGGDGQGDGGVQVTSLMAREHDHAVLGEGATLDEKTLGALGYKQEFKR